MGTYPRTRKFAGYRKCDICGKSVQARGIGGHKRLKHGITRVVTRVIDISNNASTQVINSSDNASKEPTQVKSITQDLSGITGKDLSECIRLDGQHLYTDQDLWILLSRISRVLFSSPTDSLMSRWDCENTCHELIRDFEQRFQCKFGEITKANPHIKPAKTDQENADIASRYAHLKYSRAGGFLQENWTKE